MGDVVKRILNLFFITFIIIGFCSCTKSLANTNDSESDPVVISYCEDGTVNGYKQQAAEECKNGTCSRDENGRMIINSQTDESSAGNSASTCYCVNKNTKKFHKGECSAVARTKPENIRYESDREKLISEGYQPCKNCNP